MSSPHLCWCIALLFLLESCVCCSAHSRTASSSPQASGDPVYYYVSVTGSDSASGDADHPFATIQRAQKAVRALKASHGGHIPPPGVTVEVVGGGFDFSGGPLELTDEDSGEENARVTYFGRNSGMYGGKTILFPNFEHHSTVKVAKDSGDKIDTGDQVDSEGVEVGHGETGPRATVADADERPSLDHTLSNRLKRDTNFPDTINILKVNLKNLGITDYGNLGSGQLGNCANNKLEAFYAGEPLILARHPNVDASGHPQFISVGKVLNNQSSFQFSDSKLASLNGTSSLWLHGYWKFDWADNYVHVAELDGSTSTVVTDPKTPPVYGYETNARFYALNALELLDSPGEYYLDRSTGILYFALPSNAPTNDYLYVSMSPTVVTMTNLKYFTLVGFGFAYSRTTTIVSTNSLNVTVANASVAFSGGAAMSFANAVNTLIHNITVHSTSCGGIYLSGGDLQSLTRANSIVQYCNVSDFARWKRTYQAAVGFGGVGNFYVHNTITDGPHTAMLGSCNDCLFEYNSITHMCYESTDTGAFYTGYSWIHRGNVVRNNYFAHIRATEKTTLGYPSVQAIYLDDQMSGYEIYNNTFVDCQKGTFIGGGRRNHVHNNYYESCDTAVHLDNRGLNWQHASCLPTGRLFQEMDSVHYTQPPWSVHYPDLLTIPKEHPCYPAFTSFESNTYCRCKAFSDFTAAQATALYATLANNVEKCP